MATKLKKTRPFVTLVIFMMAVTALFLSCLGLAHVALDRTEHLGLDYKDTQSYHQNMSELLRAAYVVAADMHTSDWTGSYFSARDVEQARRLLQEQGVNIAYFISWDDKTYRGNTEEVTADGFTRIMQDEIKKNLNENIFGFRRSNEGFEHFITIQNDTINELVNTRTGQTNASMMFIQTRYARNFSDTAYQSFLTSNEDKQNLFVGIGVRADGQMLNYGSLYRSFYEWYRTTMYIFILSCALIAALVFLIGVFIKRRSLALAGDMLAKFMGWFWMELKVIGLLIALMILFVGSIDLINGLRGSGMIIGAVAGLWAAYFILLDMGREKANFFRNNIFMSVSRFLKGLESNHTFLSRMKKRLVIMVAAEIILLILAVFSIFAFDEAGFIFALLLAGLGIFLLSHYILTYNRNMDDFARIIDYTNAIRAGNAKERLQLSKESDFNGLAESLNDIHSGMLRMVDERVKSEQMKVELITNVSHDLKTPLTSIINYTDLLSREQLTPEFANDYVRILASKSQRLKNLVQDLFEISKANSGTIDLDMQQLNLTALLEQTTAELDERSKQIGIEVRLNFLVNAIMVRADGKKMHRVFENLLGNALKYAMAGTRVYVTAEILGQYGVVTFKNISNYEMNFTPQDIMERFSRGDPSRTTEGSGLGLAIAKSFLELNGGTLEIELDGDLFKAIVHMPLYVPYVERTAAPETAEETAEMSIQIPLQPETPQESAVPQGEESCPGTPYPQEVTFETALSSEEDAADPDSEIGIFQAEQPNGAELTPPRWGITEETFTKIDENVSPEAERLWQAMEIDPRGNEKAKADPESPEAILHN